VVGGTSGQIWAGDDLLTATPLFLDRIPDSVGTMTLPQAGGGTAGYSVPFSANFFAVGVRGNDFPAFAALHDLSPSAPISGADGWLVTNSARILKVSPILAANATLLQTLYGPRILDPFGNPASGPYQGGALGPTDSNTFVISASDSLYVYPVSALRLIPFVNPAEDLSPEFTPQAGSPIRSLTVQPLAPGEDLDAGIHGYAISGNALYSFSRDGTPQQWNAARITLSGSEPVETWGSEDDRRLGRVGFRDGSVFTLPGGIPFVDPLPSQNGDRPIRAMDFENVMGWPVCLSNNGLFMAKQVTGQRTLVWDRVAVGPLLLGVLTGTVNGKLSLAADGSLLLFLDRGRVYQFTVSLQ
jgi:hypothetical protein